MRVEGIAFEPGIVIDERAVAAQLGHEDLVAQTLRRADVGLVPGQPQLEVRPVPCHAPVSPSRAIPCVSRKTRPPIHKNESAHVQRCIPLQPVSGLFGTL